MNQKILSEFTKQFHEWSALNYKGLWIEVDSCPTNEQRILPYFKELDSFLHNYTITLWQLGNEYGIRITPTRDSIGINGAYYLRSKNLEYLKNILEEIRELCYWVRDFEDLVELYKFDLR